MKIEERKITVRELSEGYVDSEEEGVRGFGGRLDIRPKYQREFIYKDKQREEVVQTILKGFPLNTMYWAKREDGTFEVIDGQQRTVSICQYISGVYSVKIGDNTMYYHNLQDDIRERILGYELTIYVCEGTDTEKLDWFRVINIAGEKLTEQELRNAVYAGSWVTDAKKYFSKSNCVASQKGGDYMSGSPIRQDYLETVISWLAPGGEIEGYMSVHQHDANATQLWMYFSSVITWVQSTFTVKRAKYMKGVEWGLLYNNHKDKVLDAKALEAEIKRLLIDDDVTRKSGVYAYVLTRDEKHLSIRAFTDAMKVEAYERQLGVCPHCGKHYGIEQMEGDHITPWHEGGRTIAENLQMLCKSCNRKKGGK